MGCGSSSSQNDDGKGNKARVLDIPQRCNDEQRKQRADNIAANQKLYEWVHYPDATQPSHCKETPPSERDAAEKHWNGQMVLDIVASGTKMGFNTAFDEVGDILQKVFQCGPEDPFEDFYETYSKGEVPKVADRWQLDQEFARQRLQGCLPIYIKKVSAEKPLPEKFSVGNDDVKNMRFWPSGKSFDEAVAEDKVYWCDYDWLQSILDDDDSGEAKRRNMCPVMILFVVADDGVLMPAAIKLTQKVEDPVIFCGGQDFVSNRWKCAKLVAQASEGALHQVANHLLTTHLAMEVVYVALKRQLPDNHPIQELLGGHFWYTLEINRGARTTLAGGSGAVVPKVMCMGFKGVELQLAKGWKEFKMSDHYDIKNQIAQRDVDKIPGYHYRDDSVLIWDSINRYVADIVGEFYKTDADVTGDFELQNFIRELLAPEVGNMRGSPFVNGSAENKDQLITFCTYVIWACTAYHAVLNNGQYDYYGFVPNAPGQFDIGPEEIYKSRDEDKDITLDEIVEAMPSKGMQLLQVSFIHVLSLGTDQRIGDFKYDPYYMKNEPACMQHLKKWKADLDSIEKKIDERNKTLEVPYEYLNPNQIASSVAI